MDNKNNKNISLTPFQLDIYLDHLRLHDSAMYNIGGIVKLYTDVDQAVFAQCFEQMVQHYCTPRLRIVEQDGSPFQCVDNTAVPFPFLDFEKEQDPQAAAKYWVDKSLKEPFCDCQGMLHRSALLRLSDKESWYFSASHHLICDGWSYALWTRELIQRYAAIVSHRNIPLTPLFDYTEFVSQELEYLTSRANKSSRQFWQGQLRSHPGALLPELSVHAGDDHEKRSHYPSIRHVSELSHETFEDLQTQARANDAEIHHLFIAALSLYFSKITGAEKIFVGLPSYNRRGNQKQSLGLFTTVSPLAVELDLNATVVDALLSVKNGMRKMARHQRFPVSDMVKMLDYGQQGKSLYDLQFNYQKLDYDSQQDVFATETHFLTNGDDQTPFVLTICEYGDHQLPQVMIDANTRYFDPQTVKQILHRILNLASRMVANSQQILADLPLLLPSEITSLSTIAYNQFVPRQLLQGFEHNAQIQGHKTALFTKDAVLSYEQLNQQATALAWTLVTDCVQPGDRVGICLARDEHLIVAILATLKCAATYVPMDPNHPEERRQLILKDSQARVLLTDQDQHFDGEANLKCLNLRTREWLNAAPQTLPAVTPAHEAYLIYTSGSTGKPKGVSVTHGNAMAMIQWAQQLYQREEIEQVAFGTSICFDISVFELFLPLNSGTCIRLLDSIIDIANLKNSHITLINTVPSAIEELLKIGSIPSTVKVINLAGEALSRSTVNNLYSETKVCKVYNLYGPTEDTVYSTWSLMARDTKTQPAIGVPVTGSYAYILDKTRQFVPQGWVGELYFGGQGVANGYWQRPELNEKAFIKNPWHPEERLFKTGDLGYVGSDGEIYYAGRIDHQVKIRGFRIELGEIATALEFVEGISRAVVTAIETPTGYQLSAYLIKNKEESEATALKRARDAIVHQLPEYMMPAYWTFLKEFPLNTNGKIDRKKLPAPVVESKQYVAPVGETQMALAAIWQSILNVEKVGKNDVFFELGGHSLTAIRLVSSIAEQFNKKLTIKHIFLAPALDKMAQLIEQTETFHQGPQLIAHPNANSAPLSSAQKRLLLIDQLEGSCQYHMVAMLNLEGDLDLEALLDSFKQLQARHETLRTRYDRNADANSEPYQIIDEQGQLKFSQVQIQVRERERFFAEAEALSMLEYNLPFDLQHEHPIRLQLLEGPKEKRILLLTMHHIATDGWSIGNMINELSILYSNKVLAQQTALPALQFSYGDFAHWESALHKDGSLKSKFDYWLPQLSGLPAVHSLPLDAPRSQENQYDGSVVSRILNTEQLQTLEAFAKAQDVTLFMLLQTVFALTLSRMSHADDIAIGVPVAGREDARLENLVGLFINTLVIRTDFNQSDEQGLTFQQVLDANKQTILNDFTHQGMPFELLVERLSPQRIPGANALCQVKFVMQNFEQQGFQLPNLDVTIVEPAHPRVRFDLDLTVFQENTSPQNNQLRLNWTYKTALFSARSIENLASAFEQLLFAVCADPTQQVNSYPLLNSSQVQAMQTLQSGAKNTRTVTSILPAIAQSAADSPLAIAVQDEHHSLSYEQLWLASSRLSSYLEEMGIEQGERIGVLLPAGCSLMVALLGVMRSSGVYVPLLSGQGSQRLQAIIDDADISLVLTESALLGELAQAPVDVMLLDDAITNDQWLSEYDSELPLPAINVDDSAYVIYTSGSTGQPKGVDVLHGGLEDYCSFASGHYYQNRHLSGSQVVTSPCFDITVPSLYVPLMHGDTVTLGSEELALVRLYDVIQNDSQQHWLIRLTPMHVQGLLAMTDGRVYEGQHVFVVGGEAFSPQLAASLQQQFPKAQIFNHYGPSETVVGCAIYDVTEHGTDTGLRLPVGRPMDNTVLYVLDEQQQLVPQGVPGELYIGGAGVARGYVNQPDLTAEKFINNPFADAGENMAPRLYRSGDRVRWNHNGYLEFLERVDHQIKVRGFRIEPGEIEQALLAQSGIKEAVVAARGDAENRQILAWVTTGEKNTAESASSEETEQLPQRLLKALAQSLPAYMIPAAIMVLEQLPVSANGKVDRKALPDMENMVVSDNYIPPSSELEEQLARIWGDILNLPQVSVTANFFELGGHSLLATQVVSAVARQLNRQIELRALFDSPTVKTLAETIQLAAKADYDDIPRVLGNGPHPLSWAQQRLWFIDQLDQGSSQYNILGSLDLKGELNLDALKQAIQAEFNRHDVLRSYFINEDGKAQTFFNETVPLALNIVHCPLQQDSDSFVDAFCAQESRHTFDLSSDELLRVHLLKLTEQHHVLVISMHHIISDGWSHNVMARELFSFYSAFNKGAEPTLPDMVNQYHDYATWQIQQLATPAMQQQLDYWRKQLAHLPALHQLPLDYARPAKSSKNGRIIKRALDANILAKLNQLCKAQRCTLNSLLQAIFSLTLYRCSLSDEIIFGIPAAGRTHPDTENLIGLFVNTLVLRFKLNPANTFKQLLEQSQQILLDALQNQDIPFDMLVDELNPERSLNHNPLYQILFSYGDQQSLQQNIDGLQVRLLTPQLTGTKVDLNLAVKNLNGQLNLTWLFATDLFHEDSIVRLADSFEHLLNQVLDNSEQHLNQYCVVPSSNKAQLMQLSQGQQVAREGTLVGKLQAQQATTPHNIAVQDQQQQLTYQQLWQRSARLAHALVERNIKSGQHVGVLLPAGCSLMVALLGVMRSSGVYVPLLSGQGSQRLQAIIDDADISLVLTESALLGELTQAPVDVMLLDDAITNDQWLSEYDSELPLPAINVDDSAYVIYTSGSTGQPKGVDVLHGGLEDYCSFASGHYYQNRHLSGSQVVTSPCFDITVPSLYVPLMHGDTVTLGSEELALVRLYDVIQNDSQQHWLIRLTPMHVQGLLAMTDGRVYEGQHVFVVGGEAFSPQLAASLQQQFPKAQIFNHYGPSETVVGCAIYDVTEHGTDTGLRLPVGRPMDNTVLYVLDEQQQLVPQGVPGELYIGGAGVARGYVNQPDLTAEKFINNPFADAGENMAPRLYRSGDRVRWNHNGYLEFLERVDHQIKVRGFRIEPGEIEQALLAQSGIKEAVVAARGDAENRQILAWVTTGEKNTAESASSEETEQLPQRLLKALAQSLPAYMIPAAIMVLEQLPVSANGKVDRKALPDMENMVVSDNYIPPSSELEEQLARIWGDILNLPQVSVTANFFELGGHSLLATQVVSAVARQLNRQIELRSIFDAPTVRALAETIQLAHSAQYDDIPHIAGSGPHPLSWAQQRLWFIDQLDYGSSQYNMSVPLKLTGQLNITALEQAITALIERHEILRTVYPGNESQLILADFPSVLQHKLFNTKQGTHDEIQLQQEIAKDSGHEFDLSKDVPIRCYLYTLAEEQYVLLIVTHHIAFDGWSRNIMLREIIYDYQRLSNDIAQKGVDALEPLPQPAISYHDYAYWQQKNEQSGHWQKQLSYWAKALEDAPAAHNLPMDFPYPERQSYQGKMLNRVLDEDLVATINTSVRQHNLSLFMWLEALLAIFIARWSDKDDVVIGTPVAGRRHQNLEDVVGLFVNTLPLRTQIDSSVSLRDFFAHKRLTTLAAFENQDVPFDLVIEHINPERSLRHAPVNQVLLSVRNHSRNDWSIPGLQLEQIIKTHIRNKFDFQLTVTEHLGKMHLSWLYASDLFHEESVARMADSFEHLLKQATQNSDRPLKDYSLLPVTGKKPLTQLGHGAQVSRQGTLVDKIAAQQALSPDKIAVKDKCQQLSYSQLWQRSARLAHALVERNIKSGQHVGVLLPAGCSLMVALLGVMRSSGVYVPLLSGQGSQRLQAIIDDADISLVLTESALLGELTQAPVDVMLLDDAITNDQWLSEYDSELPLPAINVDDSAYVIYTSGSTGQPKGVDVLHGGLEDYCSFASGHYYQNRHLSGSQVVTSPCFDITIPSLYVPLMHGDTVTLGSEELALVRLYDVIQNDSQQHWLIRLTPMHVQGLLAMTDGRVYEGQHVFVVGGEAFSPQLAASLQQQFPKAQIFNHYGPSETVVGCAIYDVTEHGTDTGLRLPVGRPMDNTVLYVLDEQQQLVPQGVPGELYIGGAGVARGYVNQPDLTAEKFINNPFADAGENMAPRLYRSGDRVRWNHNGYLEFLERVDHQIKVRGFRIEPGEIEQALLAQSGIKEAVVAARGDAENRQILAWVTTGEKNTAESASSEETEQLPQRLLKALAQSLPAYMIPAAIMVLEQLPVSANGKVDRKALPDMENMVVSDNYIPPSSELEEQLARIWGDILNLPQVSVTANFFELGGHSLMATRMVTAIRGELALDVPVRQLFENTTVRALADTIENIQQIQTNTELLQDDDAMTEMEW